MDEALPRFVLVPGGPLYALQRRLHFVRGDGHDNLRQMAFLVAVAWAPMMLLATGGRLISGRFPPWLFEASIHARMLLAVPFFSIAEKSLHVRTQRCVDLFVERGYATGGSAHFRRIISSSSRLRDSTAPELLFLVGAVILSQRAFWTGSTGVIASVSGGAGRSAAYGWYALVGLPIFQFLSVRWAWRWLIWSQLLFRLSLLDFHPIASHPDRRGGLSFLTEPSVGAGWLLMGLSSVLAAVWAQRLVRGTTDIAAIQRELLAFAVTGMAVVLGPLLFFSYALWRERFGALRAYGDFAHMYTTRFERKWVHIPATDQDPLGTADIQSLADLANSFDVVSGMRIFVFGRRDVIVLALTVLFPLLPAALTQVPLVEILRRLGKAALG